MATVSPGMPTLGMADVYKRQVDGRRSTVGLYDFNLATYDSGDSFDQSLSRGFIGIYGLSTQLAAAREQKESQK